MNKIWIDLYNSAKSKIKTQSIEPFIECGNNACAILSDNKNIYCGISITSNNSLYSTAEKSAITEMFNNGELIIKKMVILNELEELILPSSECLEYLLELSSNPEDIEILIDLEKEKVLNLSQIIPDWWGTYRNKKN